MEKRNVAIILLYNDKKEILLQHRADDAKRLPGYWAFFGGGIKQEETPEETVKRETYEELHYNLINPKKVMTQNFRGGIKYVFMEKYNPSKKLELYEGQDMKWVKLSDTNEMKIIDHDIKVLEFIKDKY
ncbi:MAG: NUDIX domain-containing protein [bacterium]|nr:NUDIX domain-containing protein [bacterium]